MISSKLEFQVDEYEGTHRVTAIVNGRRLPELVEEFEISSGLNDPAGGYDGLIVGNYRFNTIEYHFFGLANDQQGGVYLLGCECGEVGCWPLLAQIESTADKVVWKSFAQPFRPKRDYSGFGPFVFDREEYEAALTTIEKIWPV